MGEKRILKKLEEEEIIMLKQGDVPPDFSLKDKDGKLHSLKGLNSTYVILYFYPKDDTPGCTLEANLFNKKLEEFKKLKTTVIGISGGDEESKKKFCQKYGLNFALLSDPDYSVCKEYDSYGEKSFMGRKYFGILRTTFILHHHYLSKNKDYKIIKIFENVKPEGHAEEVYNFIYEDDSLTNC